MKYLVTGATGQYGSVVINELLKKISPADLAVSVRDKKKAIYLEEKGIDVRQGDFDNQEGLVQVFSGIDRLLIVSTDGDNETRIRQHLNAVNAAKEADVKFIAYTSLANASNSKLFLAEVHKKTEEAIKSTGVPYAFLRNNWYLENEASLIENSLKDIPWIVATGSGKVSWAPRADYAKAAARVLLDPTASNKIYELSGTPLTYEALALKVASVIKKDIPVNQVGLDEYKSIMTGAGLPDHVLGLLSSIQEAIASGQLDVVSNDLSEILGDDMTSIEDGIESIRANLS